MALSAIGAGLAGLSAAYKLRAADGKTYNVKHYNLQAIIDAIERRSLDAQIGLLTGPLLTETSGLLETARLAYAEGEILPILPRGPAETHALVEGSNCAMRLTAWTP